MRKGGVIPSQERCDADAGQRASGEGRESFSRKREKNGILCGRRSKRQPPRQAYKEMRFKCDSDDILQQDLPASSAHFACLFVNGCLVNFLLIYVHTPEIKLSFTFRQELHVFVLTYFSHCWRW